MEMIAMALGFVLAVLVGKAIILIEQKLDPKPAPLSIRQQW